MVTSMAMEVAYTLTMLSAYFMIQDTKRPDEDSVSTVKYLRE